MTVLVKDAISDPDAGQGKATYRWDASDSSWILISKSKTETISFETEELVISGGKVIPSNIVLDNQIWNIAIIDGDVEMFIPRIEDLIIDYTGISGLNDYNGLKLRFTYAYGNQVGANHGVDKVMVFNKPLTSAEVTTLYNNQKSTYGL